MYLPFARKWRPQDFDEIVGQEHITTTLKNAILMDRLHHAYLFTGPRGIGKTSTARIFSKALNCEKGPSAKPCNKCVFCQEITNGSSMDVIEIDGASNRGIDEIRNLREAVKFAPSACRYKIYIIDEVHMLTTEAFNALLKTLEEPPLHVKFIFATTEPHKVPATILSRCQRFDFRRIQIKDIIAKLQEVAGIEKIDIDKDAFLYIAKSSDGSMRDAESILDQIASFSKGKIHIKDIIESLGMIDTQVIFKCVDIIINKDTKGAIHLINELVDSGKDAKQFLLELLEHFRNMMIVKIGVSSDDILNLPIDAIAQIKEQAKLVSQEDIFYIVNIISNGLRMLKQLLPERIMLELCIIKLTSRDSISSIENILSKLPDLNKDRDKVIQPPQQPSHQAMHASSIQAPINPKPDIKQEPTFLKKIQQSLRNSMVKEDPIENNVKDVSIEMARVNDAWPILVKAMAVKKMSVSSYLAEGEPDSIKGNTVIIAFPKELNFHREVLEEKRNKESIEAALSQILDTPLKLSFVASDKMVKKPEEVKSEPTKEDLKENAPVINAALDMFGGRILKNT